MLTAGYEFYRGTYHGDKITAAEWPVLSRDAAACLEELTLGRTAADLAPELLERCQMALCAVAEEYKAEREEGAGVVASESVGIANTEKEKLVAGNIKSGVTILGVAGTYSGEASKLQAKTVTPTKAKQDITADEGYDALSQVTVEAIPAEYADVSGVTAAAGDVLANKVFVGADGAEAAGTMPNNGAVQASIDGLTQTEYTVPAGYHTGTGKVSLTGDIEEALAAI